MMSVIIFIRRLMSEDFMVCYVTVIRRLMSNIRCLITVIWCQTPDNSYMTRSLLSYNCYQTSDVICYVIKLLSVLMSNIRRLITVVYDSRGLLSYICYHTSDVWFYMLFYIIVIRRLITVIRCQMFDNSYITADVWCQTSAFI